MFKNYRLIFNASLLWILVMERGYAWFLLLYTTIVYLAVSRMTELLPNKIRYAGVAFNLAAIVVAGIMVVRGVYRYKVPHVFGSWGFYFSKFFDVFFRPRVLNAQVNMTAGSAVSLAMAVTRADLTGSLEDKIDQLDQRTRGIDARVDSLQGTLHKQIQDFDEKLKNERSVRSEETESVRKLVRESIFGDHGWELVVAVYLIFGLAANVPNEIAKFVFHYTGPLP